MDRRTFLGAVSVTAYALLDARPSAGDEAIALSFVHPTGRIDIARPEILSMEAYDHVEFYDPETKETTRHPDIFGVTLCLSGRVRRELKTLTANIVDEELDVMAGCDVIVTPVIREPLGNSPCFSISAHDREELDQLLAKLQNAMGTSCKSVS